MLANAIMVIILQYVSISKQHVVHLKLNTMLYTNYISVNLGEKNGPEFGNDTDISVEDSSYTG